MTAAAGKFRRGFIDQRRARRQFAARFTPLTALSLTLQRNA
jgi:hypothetical protein